LLGVVDACPENSHLRLEMSCIVANSSKIAKKAFQAKRQNVPSGLIWQRNPEQHQGKIGVALGATAPRS
jgi:hypothetical protein